VLLPLLLACAPECHPGFTSVDGECVAVHGSDTGSDDTGGTPTDDTGPTTTIDPEASQGDYACEDGFGHGYGGPALRGLCGVCDSLTCTWTVFAVDDAGTVGGAEIDLFDANHPTPWREYHDAFVAVRPDADRHDWALTLDQVLDPTAYVSNVTTWVDPRNPDTAAALTAQANVFDTEGAFLDCFAWGPDAEAVFGTDCAVVQ
jgi:hypothetical protein